MTVHVRFFADDRGTFAVTGTSSPPEAFAEHFPYRSADIGGSGEADRELVLDHISVSPADPGLAGTPSKVHSLFIYNAKDDDEILEFDRRITDEYTAFYAGHGEHYLGVYRVEGPAGLRLAEVTVYDKLLADAQGSPAGKPPSIEAIETECRALQDREDKRFVVWFEPKK